METFESKLEPKESFGISFFEIFVATVFRL